MKKNIFLLIYLLSSFIINLLASDLKITHLTFSGNSYFSSDKLLQLTNRTSDTTYDTPALESLLKDILALYLSRGFLFITVQLQEISNNTATITINEGSIIRAENFLFSGNKTTKERILMRESRIQKDQTITQQVIDTAQRRINSKRYIEDTHIVPVNNNTLLINVKEGGMTHITAIMGYASKQTQGKKLQGYITADFLNLMGTDRNFGLIWRSYHPKETASLKYHESGPVNIPLFADFLLSREQYVDKYTRTEVGADLAIDFYTQNIGTSFKLVDTYPNDKLSPFVGTPFMVSETNTPLRQTEKMIGLFYNGDFTDDIYNPTDGWELSFREYLILLNQTNNYFHRYRTDARLANYLPIGDHFSLTNAITFSHLQNKNLTEYDLLHLGGTFTLRGFFEDMYAGNSIIYTNTEFRYLLSRYSRVFIFVDYGYVEDNRPEIKTRFTDLVGMGVGLRVNTPIGLLRMDYGFHYAEGKWSNHLDPLVHFGIETVF